MTQPTRSQLEKNLSEANKDLEKLEQEAAGLAQKIAALEEQASADLSAVSVNNLAAAAKKQAAANVEIQGLKIALAEVERRVNEGRGNVADLEQDLVLIKREEGQKELDKMNQAVISELDQFILSLKKLVQAERSFESDFNSLPFIIFGSGFLDKLENKAYHAARELKQRTY